MDYVVGSVAAIVSGNVTPNRPKFMKKALTPTKHQPSPNVTPKSELVDDRTIFLSPTLQKKKAIVKKSPKRIFQNPDLDATNDGEGNPKSPKADKVKKHLKEELEADVNLLSPKSPKIKNLKTKESPLLINTGKENDEAILENSQVQNENTPKKKKKKQTSVSEESAEANTDVTNDQVNDLNDSEVVNVVLSSKTKNKKNKLSPKKVKNQLDQSSDGIESKNTDEENHIYLKKQKKKNKVIQENTSNVEIQDNLEINMNMMNKPKEKTKKQNSQFTNNVNNSNAENDNSNDDLEVKKSKKKNRKRENKNGSNNMENEETKEDEENEEREVESNMSVSKKKKKKKNTFVNPNAITDKDTDSEHDSDNEIESENEQTNKEALDTGPVEESSDEEDKVPKKQEKAQKNKEVTVNTEEVKRTLFVGNVPFSARCKKEVKKIFSKYGQIETVRIRTVPVKDGRVTPKLAVIKNELHPDRSTVNVYVKFRDESSVNEALAENGTVLNDNHLRVTRSDCTGSEHDPKCSIFIGNIPFALEDEALQQKFQQCGEIVSVRIIRDKRTNAGKGFGYVNFKSKDAVELALALSEEDLTIKNRILRVKRCTQNTQKQKPQQDNRRGNFQGNYNRGNVQSRNQFRNRGDNRNVGRPNNNDSKTDGAYRRVMNKRKNQDGGEGPPDKRQRNIKQPGKKTRKEFVGMTAEKKKKHKLNKGQKKKKALGEVLTKL
ncbi:unnamed protein product [Parnassius apollo]|uniref:(apollo) hypothetical protein n=1 Tax=Parnassius apollo TaxID=110799 RepID=A0A8S3XHT9_PARAO|nr:unnamed protein product [Parnassius apollo]